MNATDTTNVIVFKKNGQTIEHAFEMRFDKLVEFYSKNTDWDIVDYVNLKSGDRECEVSRLGVHNVNGLTPINPDNASVVDDMLDRAAFAYAEWKRELDYQGKSTNYSQTMLGELQGFVKCIGMLVSDSRCDINTRIADRSISEYGIE